MKCEYCNEEIKGKTYIEEEDGVKYRLCAFCATPLENDLYED